MSPSPAVQQVVAPSTIAVPYFLVHALTIGEYGLFRDEFYYLACARHLAWGYVDHPPLVAAIAWAGTAGFGDGPFGVRVLSVLFGVATIVVTGLLVGRLGGGRFAQLLACAAVAVAPHYLFVFHILSMNGSEILLWTLAGYLAVIAVQDRRPAAWLLLGVVCGLGLLNKHSMLVFGLGLAAGLAATPARRAFATPWPWLAGALAAAIFLPHVLWQVQHGWPTLEFIRNAQAYKIADMSVAAFLREQVLMTNPFAAPIWIAGLAACVLRGWRPEWRLLGWCYLVVLAVFLLQKAKPYYVMPVYPLLLAPGAIVFERGIRSRPRRVLAVSVLLAGGALLAPLALPVLSVERLIAYQRAIGIAPGAQENHELGALPQHYADMFGWEEFARTISTVYLSLPEQERVTARVYASNYGQAGALEYFARKYPLPAVISAHNNYWYWGPGPEGGTLIAVGATQADWEEGFENVREAARTACTYCMPYENGVPIFVARGWKVRLRDVWPGEKKFI